MSTLNGIKIEDIGSFKVFRISFESVAYLQNEDDDIVYLSLITTDKASRGKGLAKKLLCTILDYYKDKKIYTIIPDSLTSEDNELIISFFKQHGFSADDKNAQKLWFNLS